MLGILWFCSAHWRHLARNGSPDSSQLGWNMMNNAHLKSRIEPISELLLLVKPAASSCLPLDHEFPFVGSRVSTLGSTFTVEGFPTCQKMPKGMLCYFILCYVVSIFSAKTPQGENVCCEQASAASTTTSWKTLQHRVLGSYLDEWKWKDGKGTCGKHCHGFNRAAQKKSRGLQYCLRKA